MKYFKLSTAERGEINLVNEFGTGGGKYRLPGNELWTANFDFGRIRLNPYRGNGYEIWYSRYEAENNFSLFTRSDSPLLMLYVQLNQNFEYSCNGMELAGRRGQYGMINLPFVESCAQFTKGSTFETFAIHFGLDFLRPYAGYSPRLMKFLEMAEAKKTARLPDDACPLPPSMEDQVRAILAYPYHGGLADRFIEGRVNELLILLVHHLSLLDKFPAPDPLEAEKAEAAKKIISGDLSRFHSVEMLARRVHTTEAKLQATFRQLYGVTVGKFSRELRLKKAYELLHNEETSRETLLSISLAVGYNDVANFCNAFKQYFGYPPGSIHKRLKR